MTLLLVLAGAYLASGTVYYIVDITWTLKNW